MSNPTSNYGFVLPTPTDLVTDLPADFEVALQGVDTTLKALQPGTTLGDLAYSSATANTNTRLAIGSNGDVLTITAGVPGWAAPSSGGMTLLSTTALTGASVTISSINQTYVNLQVILIGTTNSGASLYSPRIAPNGSTTITTTSGQVNATNKDLPDTYLWTNMDANMSLTNTDNIHVINIYGYASTTALKAVDIRAGFRDSGLASRSSNGGGFIITSSAITSLVLSYGAGNFNSGTCLIYGVK
jgi:hypothetical protein